MPHLAPRCTAPCMQVGSKCAPAFAVQSFTAWQHQAQPSHGGSQAPLNATAGWRHQQGLTYSSPAAKTCMCLTFCTRSSWANIKPNFPGSHTAVQSNTKHSVAVYGTW